MLLLSNRAKINTNLERKTKSLLLMANLPLKVKMLEHSESLSMFISSGDTLRTFLYASPQCATLGLGPFLRHSYLVH